MNVNCSIILIHLEKGSHIKWRVQKKNESLSISAYVIWIHIKQSLMEISTRWCSLRPLTNSSPDERSEKLMKKSTLHLMDVSDSELSLLLLFIQVNIMILNILQSRMDKSLVKKHWKIFFSIRKFKSTLKKTILFRNRL